MTCSFYHRPFNETKYSLLGARRLKPIRAQKDNFNHLSLNVSRVEGRVKGMYFSTLKNRYVKS